MMLAMDWNARRESVGLNTMQVPESDRERGVVLSFDSAKGCGRIRAECGDVLWVNFSVIRQKRGFRMLSAGQHVEFTRMDAPGPVGQRVHARDVLVVTAPG
jgi:cold shock CspA family protein